MTQPVDHGEHVRVRPATSDDRIALERCFVELQAWEQQIEPNRVDGASIAVAYIDGLFDACAISDGQILVAESGGGVVGFVCVLARTDSGEIIERWPERAHITDIVVLSEHRGLGIGRALLEAAESYAIARGARTLMLGVLAGNEPARRLYESAGFQESEVTLKKAIG